MAVFFFLLYTLPYEGFLYYNWSHCSRFKSRLQQIQESCTPVDLIMRCVLDYSYYSVPLKIMERKTNQYWVVSSVIPESKKNQIKGKLHAQVDGLHNITEYSGWFIDLMETNGNQWLPGECRKTAFSYKCKTDLQLLSFLIDLLMTCKLMEVNGCL